MSRGVEGGRRAALKIGALIGLAVLPGCRANGSQVNHNDGPSLHQPPLTAKKARHDILDAFPVGQREILHEDPRNPGIFSRGPMSFKEVPTAHGKKEELVFNPYFGPKFRRITNHHFTLNIGPHYKMTGIIKDKEKVLVLYTTKVK